MGKRDDHNLKLDRWVFHSQLIPKLLSCLAAKTAQINIYSNNIYRASFCHRGGTDVFIHRLSKASSTVAAVIMPTTLSLPFFHHFLNSIFTLLSRRMYRQLASSSVKVAAPWFPCASLHLLHCTTTVLTLQLLASYSWFTPGWLMHRWELEGS